MMEYVVENEKLRKLSRAYSDGRMPLTEYRENRRQILLALDAGQVESDLDIDALESMKSERPTLELRLPDDFQGFYKTMPPSNKLLANQEEPLLLEPAQDWDDNTRMLATIIVISIVVAILTLVYVFVV